MNCVYIRIPFEFAVDPVLAAFRDKIAAERFSPLQLFGIRVVRYVPTSVFQESVRDS